MRNLFLVLLGPVIVLAVFLRPGWLRAGEATPRGALYHAAGNGDLAKVQKLLATGVDPNEAIHGGFTPLMFASEQGHAQVVRVLIERGADVNLTNLYGDRAVNFAHAHKHRDIEEFLIRTGSHGPMRKYEDRVITILTREMEPWTGIPRQPDQVRSFIQRGMQAARQCGFTGEREVFSYLLAAVVFGEDFATHPEHAWIRDTLLNRKLEPGTRKRRFLDILWQRHPRLYLDVFTRDVQFGIVAAWFAAARRNDVGTLRAILDRGLDVDHVDRETGECALLKAARPGHVGAVQELIRAGARLNHADRYGFTALHRAAANGRTKVVELLLARGAKVDFGSQMGITPLEMATRNNYEEVTTALRRAGATETKEKNRGKTSGTTALLDAASEGRVSDVLRLLRNGLSPNARDANGYTPLMMAAGKNRIDVMALLLRQGAKVNARCKVMGDQSTALMMAANNGHPTAVSILLRAGASVDMRNTDGATALHYAAREGRAQVVWLLLQAGARTDLTDEKGWIPLVYARRNGHRGIVQFMERAGRDRARDR